MRETPCSIYPIEQRRKKPLPTLQAVTVLVVMASKKKKHRQTKLLGR